MRRRLPRPGFGDIVLIAAAALLIALVVLPGAIAPHTSTAFDSLHPLEPPSVAFPFGTDEYGRDVFSRILIGTRPTLLLALAAAAVGVALGATTGLAAGYLSGPWDDMLMRSMDTLISFPGLILAMLVVVMLGPAPVNLVAAIALVFWPRSARVVRSVVLDLARRDFVEAARLRGESSGFILFRELLPNVLPIIVVDFSLRITSGILLAASLAYLGIGVTAPTPAWGLMVRDGQQFLELAPWLAIFPCVAIALVSMAAVLAGERLRHALAIPGGRPSP